jgi:TrmH family RNA methyltransferase
MSTPLSNVRIVLVRPTHPGNIGAAARAMKTMGLSSLCLVEPCAPRDGTARAMAAGALDVLEGAVACPSLAEALADCTWVIGTSARLRRIEWPELEPQEAARELLARAETRPVALLFGPERSGLTNEDLDHCRALVTIAANPQYPSLNISAAVQILAYEIRKAWLDGRKAASAPRTMPTHEDMRFFYGHLRDVLVESGFLNPVNPRMLMRRMVRLFNRAAPDDNELNILRGVLTAVQQKWRKRIDPPA